MSTAYFRCSELDKGSLICTARMNVCKKSNGYFSETLLLYTEHGLCWVHSFETLRAVSGGVLELLR